MPYARYQAILKASGDQSADGLGLLGAYRFWWGNTLRLASAASMSSPASGCLQLDLRSAEQAGRGAAELAGHRAAGQARYP